MPTIDEQMYEQGEFSIMNPVIMSLMMVGCVKLQPLASSSRMRHNGDRLPAAILTLNVNMVYCDYA